MLALRRAGERGHADHGWLDSYHTFSFGDYYDPKHMGFSHLRVINDDRVFPSGGFGTHGHKDMKIISYVLDGALKHEDSMGNGSIIRPGDVRRMSAGTCVIDGEFNASDSEPVRFLQIWVLPEEKGLQPSYEQKTFADDEKQGYLRLVGSRDGRQGSVTIHQNVDLYATLLSAGDHVSHVLADGRKGWVQVAQGSAVLNEQQLNQGDGVAIEGPATLALTGMSDAELLLFDMR